MESSPAKTDVLPLYHANNEGKGTPELLLSEGQSELLYATAQKNTQWKLTSLNVRLITGSVYFRMYQSTIHQLCIPISVTVIVVVLGAPDSDKATLTDAHGLTSRLLPVSRVAFYRRPTEALTKGSAYIRVCSNN